MASRWRSVGVDETSLLEIKVVLADKTNVTTPTGKQSVSQLIFPTTVGGVVTNLKASDFATPCLNAYEARI